MAKIKINHDPNGFLIKRVNQKKIIKKASAKLKPISLKIRMIKNPAWEKQYKIARKELQKLSAILVYFIKTNK